MSQSDGEAALEFQLKAKKIPFEREYKFLDDRRFRFDFVIWGPAVMLAVEVEGGSYTGGHKRGEKFDTDCEKSNLAVLAGWRVLRFSPRMVESGEALITIEKAVKAFI